jgi:putative transposase
MVDWPHAPVHHFEEGGMFFVTGATYLKQRFYGAPGAPNSLQQLLFSLATEHGCWLQAWCLLSNHYHLVVQSEIGSAIKSMLDRFHSEAALALNETENQKGRKVWYQYWDKTLTFERSWLARLRYTHENAVHHGIVPVATNYPWCSASWFERTAKPSFVKTVSRIKIDKVNVYDDF